MPLTTQFSNPLVSTVSINGSHAGVEVDEEKGEARSSLATPSIWYTPSKLPERLNVLASGSYIYDTLIEIVSVFPEVERFFTLRVPTFINSSFAFLPVALAFVPSLFKCVTSKDPIVESEDELTRLENKISDMLGEMLVLINQTDDSLKQALTAKLNDLVQIKETLLQEKRENKESEKYELYDNVINAIYLLTRAAAGALMIIRATNAESEETGKKIDEADKWIKLVTNLAYLGYMLGAYYSKHKRKKTETNQVTSESPTHESHTPLSQHAAHFFNNKKAPRASCDESHPLTESLLVRSNSF